ncbi:MAG: D-alanine--D-alanine ligase family protein [Smithellaceae bacterium]
MQRKVTSRKPARLKIGVLYGGRSGEHDVSLCSAASVVAALDKTKYDIVAIGIDRDGRWYVQPKPEIVTDKSFGKILKLAKQGRWFVNHFEEQNRLCIRDLDHAGREVSVDLVFPVLHGTYGEDGTLQGLLELARVPYVGVDVAGAAVGMDKDIAKRLLAQAGICVVPWITVGKTQWRAQSAKILKEAMVRLGLPLFVKPLCTGSSVGVVKVKHRKDLAAAVEYAFSFDTRVMIEKGIDCREIECAVLGNDCPEASVLGEILPNHDFYSYEAKYLDPQGAAMNIPAKIPARLAAAMRKCAVAGYAALNCNAMGRVDFFLEKKTNNYYLNEINTLPGFTSVSMYPKLWEATGLPYRKLLDRLIDLALERHDRKMAIQTDVTG